MLLGKGAVHFLFSVGFFWESDKDYIYIGLIGFCSDSVPADFLGLLHSCGRCFGFALT